MLVLVLWLVGLAAAAPFVATWRTTQPNEIVLLPTILTFPNVNLTINWGDSTPEDIIPSPSYGCVTLYNFNHTYALAGNYNMSIEGFMRWSGGSGSKDKLVNIVSWGDGFIVQHSSALFADYANLQVSAPPNTQPVFWSPCSLQGMFSNSSFNAPLNWDLTNVTSVALMFAYTPLNQPITFRNTRKVTSMTKIFQGAMQFNQPFLFDDASGLLDAIQVFFGASAFNQAVNFTNSSQIWSTREMFSGATSFNKPLSLTRML